ncbi:MAG TPA: hypothetical protein VGR07_16735, partial [Thermoanaerobaculia bacterium]|nr:hypothetical protein [Thermoanaerobaculia bacterium]
MATPTAPARPETEAFLARLTAGGERPAVCLVTGDLVLAAPAAERIAEALAAAAGCAVETHRRPASIAPLLADLATYSLFAAGKVLLAIDTAVLADRSAAAALIDDAAEGIPAGNAGAGEARDIRALGARERQAAVRLLQALHLFDVNPYEGSTETAIEELPGWALEGGPGRRGKRGKRQLEDLKTGLAALLEAARREGIQGTGGSDLSELSAIVRGGRGERDGLPAGHALVLAERTAPADHPVVALLAERRAVLALGGVEAARGGAWEGVERLAAELERQTGAAIASDALAELARRTLRQEGDGKKGGAGSAEADSTARFAGEYRKLAGLVGGGAPGGKIDRKLVLRAVEDRGEEDVWQLLDAVAQGRPGEALDRLHRLVGSAEDPLAARLSFFSLFASFCRQLTALRGMMRLARVPAGDENYSRFKDRHAPSLQGSLPTGGKNPLTGIHPFRLHRAYLAASR